MTEHGSEPLLAIVEPGDGGGLHFARSNASNAPVNGGWRAEPADGGGGLVAEPALGLVARHRRHPERPSAWPAPGPRLDAGHDAKLGALNELSCEGSLLAEQEALLHCFT